MVKIVVFGATGGTGRQVVRQALEKGYQVVAFTRNTRKITLEWDDLIPFEGDILDASRVSDAIKGVDAVISTLGPRDNKAKFVVTSGMGHILAGMKQHGVSRLIVTAGAGVGDPNDQPGFINKFMNFLLEIISRNVYEDMVKAVEVVRRSDVDWTIVRVPMLTDGPKTGEIKAAWVGKGMGMRISRQDYAAFLLEQLIDDTYIHQAPAISN
jgi:putative NADH-flavin reductase